MAKASGVTQSRIVDWRDAGAVPSTKNARVVALALGVPVPFAFVAAGFLTAEEANLPELQAFSTLELLHELERRFDEVQRSRRRLAVGLVSSGGSQGDRAHTDAVFAEAERVIKLRESSRPAPRRKLRAVADMDDQMEPPDGGR